MLNAPQSKDYQNEPVTPDEHPVTSGLGSPDEMIERVLEKLSQLSVDVSAYEADHICFRCASAAEYRSTCAFLGQQGQLLIESMIGGRPIATFLLARPIVSNGFSIRCIEVPCPKAGRPYQSGWEHVEFVIGSENDSVHERGPLVEFVHRFPNVSWDLRALDKDCNADVSLQVGEGISCKFHLRPLDLVIQHEKQTGLVHHVPPDYWHQSS